LLRMNNECLDDNGIWYKEHDWKYLIAAYKKYQKIVCNDLYPINKNNKTIFNY
jgi:hypothetical protein